MHQVLRRVSRGRLGTAVARGDGLGTLFLHTTGRRSGQSRANGLNYLLDGADLVVVATNAGSETVPAWWLNLCDQPEADVEIAGERRPVHARLATDEEATRIWSRFVAASPGYAVYRTTARRPIPVVILEPR